MWTGEGRAALYRYELCLMVQPCVAAKKHVWGQEVPSLLPGPVWGWEGSSARVSEIREGQDLRGAQKTSAGPRVT